MMTSVKLQSDRIQHLKENLPIKLAKRNLIINESKTEEYIISAQIYQDTSLHGKAANSWVVFSDTENDISTQAQKID